MHATLSILYAMIVGCFGAPVEWGGGFSFGGESETNLSGGLSLKADNGKVSGDIKGSAATDLDSHVNGGLYRESNGKFVGINGGIHGKIGGAVDEKVHGEIGRNKDGSISVGANSTISTTSFTGLGGHASLATGDAERRHIAEFEGKTFQSNSKDHGTETDLVPLISTVGNIIDNFWLYFWLAIGGVILITCCCLFTVCGFYWKLVGDVKSLKTEMIDMVKGVKETKPAYENNSEVLFNKWSTE